MGYWLGKIHARPDLGLIHLHQWRTAGERRRFRARDAWYVRHVARAAAIGLSLAGSLVGYLPRRNFGRSAMPCHQINQFTIYFADTVDQLK